MPLCLIILAAFWVAFPDVSAAQQSGDPPAPVAARLSGLGAAEAASLIRSLQDAQRRLRAGEQLVFELLSGAPASYSMTEISPRRAFLNMAFGNAVIIERVPSSNRLWQPYRLTIAPGGPGQTIWDIEVVLGFQGNIERVQMVFRPPPPF